jgi:hypothetical protein
MPRKIPDNAASGIEDILDLCGKARGNWRKIMQKAEQLGDLAMVIQLASVRDDLAEIERKARDARQNIYKG